MVNKQGFFGTDAVSFGAPDPVNTVPSLTTATLAVSAITPTAFANNSSRAPLPAGSIKVWAAAMGYDPTGGYTLAQSTPTMGSGQTITSGQGLLVRIAQPWTGFTGLANAIAVALFVQIGSADPVMTDWAFINSKTDFSWIIATAGDPNAPTFPAATLISNSILDANMGTTRTPKSVIYTPLTPTTDGIEYLNKHEGFDFKPDNSSNYPVVTVRSTDVQFKLLDFQLSSLAKAIGADYVSGVDTNSALLEQYSGDIFSIASQLTGNQPLYFVKPKKGGRLYRTLMLGNVQVSTADVTVNAKKDAPTQIPFNCTHAALDSLVNGMANTITFSNGGI